ncbi:hypothetical protein H8K32_00005 [Undibacterium jejuense]|uniref:Uncharacterized protein n=1 Tax=Undibacterium jejuense TaxID=1344949 RepID=A0A923HBA2_9BURK|nr:hypothetical protein [Undibacterium jejuense]
MSIFSFLPILCMFAIYTSLVKLAAFLYKRTILSWKHAFIYTTGITVVSMSYAALTILTEHLIPVPVTILIGLAMQLGFGGWYLGSKAQAANNGTLGFKQGVWIAVIANVLLSVCTIPMFVFILLSFP